MAKPILVVRCEKEVPDATQLAADIGAALGDEYYVLVIRNDSKFEPISVKLLKPGKVSRAELHRIKAHIASLAPREGVENSLSSKHGC